MPKFLIEANYTLDGVKGVAERRRQAVGAMRWRRSPRASGEHSRRSTSRSAIGTPS